MPHRRRLLAPLAGLVLALAAPAAADAQSAACAGADTLPTATNIAEIQSATLCLLNQERTSRGLVAITSDADLEAAAVRYSRSMVRDGFFAHVSPTGSTMVRRIKATDYLDGANGWTLGENLAWGTGARSTPAQTVTAWMASPGHRRNILEPRFRHVGIGVAAAAPVKLAISGTPAATYTTEFGVRG